MILIYSAILLATIFMLGWLYAIKIKNVSIVDAMWALSLPLPLALYWLFLMGNPVRDFLVFGMALFWSLRLGSHLIKRIYQHHPEEDTRYQNLRSHWENKGSKVNANFLIIFMMNATLVLLLSLPFYYALQNSAPMELLEWIGMIVFILGVIGELLSDKQLSDFKKQQDRSVICEVGLWNYSRHPNYFFEAVVWIGIYIFCSASPGGAFTFHAPLLMILLLTKVSGIPPTEHSLLKSKGDAYRHYQETTSAFVPWFKKSN